MTQSTRSESTRKVRKPRPDFPLTPHPSGRWCKKVRGKLHYFGPTRNDEEGQAALEEWLRVKDDLLAGRKPREKRDGLEMLSLVVAFLQAKEKAVKSGELTQRSWNDYRNTCRAVLKCFGRTRIVEDLRPTDFGELKQSLSAGRNLTTIGNEIQRARCLFRFASDNDLIVVPVKYGPDFKRPSKKSRRRLRNDRQPLAYSADEIRQLISAANTNLAAMILLGINCGFGNTDVAQLPIATLDLDAGWHTFGRPKTGVERRCALWPETIAALRQVLNKRPAPKSPEHAGLVFLTRHGQPYVRLQMARSSEVASDTNTVLTAVHQTTWNDAISREMGKLLRAQSIKRPGLNFYSLRRTFRTVADAVGDQPAAVFIMGHADSDSDMSAIYRQHISNDRLLSVAEHVRNWLFGLIDKNRQIATIHRISTRTHRHKEQLDTKKRR